MKALPSTCGRGSFDWAKAKGFPIVLWGRSLGSGPATYVAREREADALLLETPFDSAVSVAADRYGFLPVGLLMQDQFPADSWIKDVAEPVFVAHGTADRTIGVEHGKRVYALAPDPDGLWIEAGADHSDLWARGIWTRAMQFFELGNIPVIGIVENMAGYQCPHCGEISDPFGEGGAEEVAREKHVPFLGRIPLAMTIRTASDEGHPPAAGVGPEADAFAAIARKLTEWLDG